MRNLLPQPLLKLADACPSPLYLVGGSVRDFLAGTPVTAHTDFDIASAEDSETLARLAERCGLCVRAVYPRTGTVKLEDEEGIGYEFTRFRTDLYEGGTHAPAGVSFTEDIETDAKRRDFCANAVYFDIKAGIFCDPLGGMEDVARKVFRTTRPAKEVFSEDGLRLMRLARLCAETGFSPDDACLAGARANASLIAGISAERVFHELDLLLLSDKKGGSPYRGLKILHESGVLARILPELAEGDGMLQRSDFHAHDVLEHSFRCVLYSPPDIRFAALLHDVGKPYCFLRDGNFHAHAEEGARIAQDFLTRLKAPKSLTRDTVFLVRTHMLDLDGKTRETKVRKYLAEAGALLSPLLELKQADYSASKDDLSPAPTVLRWKEILRRMEEEHIPLTVQGLEIGGDDVRAAGVPAEKTGGVLSLLFGECLAGNLKNTRQALLARLEKLTEEI